MSSPKYVLTIGTRYATIILHCFDVVYVGTPVIPGQGCSNCSALMIASQQGNSSAVDILLKYGGDIAADNVS